MRKILIIDGQGGQIGSQLIKSIIEYDVEIMAVGTNSTATNAMLKAGAKNGATGENPVIVGCKTADIIIGPIGIVIADSLYGEITPKMAIAVGQSNAKKILIPINKCDNIIVGVNDLSLTVMIKNVLKIVEDLI
ncbi:MAG: DUF3842 family protein [Bacilli bacterium]|jgi:hypothetical protein|nr:DUF3842 family protein [Bacilli bacterium]